MTDFNPEQQRHGGWPWIAAAASVALVVGIYLIRHRDRVTASADGVIFVGVAVLAVYPVAALLLAVRRYLKTKIR